MNGYSVEINTAAGMIFRCPYKAGELEFALGAVKRHIERMGEKHFDIIISRCDEPSDGPTIEQWAERGGTLD